MGYFTFGGDDKGGLGILGDLWKSEIYLLGEYINERAGGEIIPYNTLHKPASAELKKDQVSYGTNDGMPPYAILDPLLRDYFENRIDPQTLYERYTALQPERPHDWVKKVIDHVERMDYKRRQAAPLLRVSRKKTFDWIGRRVPAAKMNLHDPIVPCDVSLTVQAAPSDWFRETLSPTLKALETK